jgi:hypothetical protein
MSSVTPQERYPQPAEQKQGCGFPVIKFLLSEGLLAVAWTPPNGGIAIAFGSAMIESISTHKTGDLINCVPATSRRTNQVFPRR